MVKVPPGGCWVDVTLSYLVFTGYSVVSPSPTCGVLDGCYSIVYGLIEATLLFF